MKVLILDGDDEKKTQKSESHYYRNRGTEREGGGGGWWYLNIKLNVVDGELGSGIEGKNGILFKGLHPAIRGL